MHIVLKPALTPSSLQQQTARYHDVYVTVNLTNGNWFLPRCMQCRCGLAMRILSVRPSVRHTRGLW